MNKRNLLIWGVISGLFVVSASQCSKKRKRGSASGRNFSSVSGVSPMGEFNWQNSGEKSKESVQVEEGVKEIASVLVAQTERTSGKKSTSSEELIEAILQRLRSAIQAMSALVNNSHSAFVNSMKAADGAMLQKICKCHYRHCEILDNLSKDSQSVRSLGFEANVHSGTTKSLLYALFHTVLYFGWCEYCDRKQYDAAVDGLLKKNVLSVLMNEINNLGSNQGNFKKDVFEQHFNAWQKNVVAIRRSKSAPWTWRPGNNLYKLRRALHDVHLVLAFLPMVDSDVDVSHDDNCKGPLIAFLKRIDNFFMKGDDIELEWFLALNFDALISGVDTLESIALKNLRTKRG